jgi:WD40 repeat protein
MKSKITIALVGIVAVSSIGFAQSPNYIWKLDAGYTTRIAVSGNGETFAAWLTSALSPGFEVRRVDNGSFVASFGMPAAPQSLALSRDGDYVAAGTTAANGGAQVFSMATGTRVALLPSAGTGPINVVRFSTNPSGPQRLAIANNTNFRRVRVYSDNGAGVWDWDNFTEYSEGIDRQVADIAFNSSGTQFAVVYAAGNTPQSAVFTVASPGAPTIEHNSPAPSLSTSSEASISWSPDNSQIVVTAPTGFAVYPGNSANQIGSSVTGLSGVRNATYRSNNQTFFIRASNQLQEWNAVTQMFVNTYNSSANVNWIAHAWNSNKVVATCSNSTVASWTVDNVNETVIVENTATFVDARSMAISPDLLRIVAAPAISNFTVTVYTAATGTIERTIAGGAGQDRVNDFAFGTDPEVCFFYIRSNSGGTSRVTRFNIATGSSAGTPFVPTVAGGTTTSYQGGIDITADGARLAMSNYADRSVTVWDIASGAIFGVSNPLPGNSITNVRFSPDGTRLVVGTAGDNDNKVHIYNVTASTLTLAGSSPHLDESTDWVAWAPNGSFVVSRQLDRLLRWNPNDMNAAPVQLGAEFDQGRRYSFVDISPDSSRVVTAAGGVGITIRSAVDGSPIANFPGVPLTRVVRFTPDGQGLITGSISGINGIAVPGAAPSLGGTIFWEGPNSGPLPRLMVGWRTDNGTVVLPTVVIDVAPANWQVRAIGPFDNDTTDDLVWQNTDPNFGIPGLVAFWTLSSDGTPAPAGTGGAPPTFNWIVTAFTDLNGDGVSDILWYNDVTRQVAIWYRDAIGDVIGTAVVGDVPMDWRLVTAGGPGNRLFFQNTNSGDVVYWTIDNSGVFTGAVAVGSPGSVWVLSGYGSFDAGSPGLLFRNSSNDLLAYWNIDSSGVITGTGVLGEAPAGWVILGVGRL